MKVWTQPYPVDNDLNVFGDYTHLVQIMFAPSTQRLHILANTDTGIFRILTEEEYNKATHVLFMQNAKEIFPRVAETVLALA